MRKFRVVGFDAGIIDGNEDVVVEAESEHQAATQVFGGPLVTGGKPGQVRAQVSPVSDPDAKTIFYVPPVSN